MAATFISSIAARVLMKLATPAYNEFCLAWGVKSDLQKLERTLSTIKAVLLDAEEQQAHNHELRDWLWKLRVVCYDVEDVLDEFEVESLRKQVVKQGSIKRKVCHFFSSSNPLAFNFKLGHKIKNIRKRLDEIAAEKAKFHLTQKVDNRRVVQRERETHSFVVASDVIGRDEEKEEVIEHLMHPGDSGNLSVIPIVGMGGLGKTALAKLVYNDERAVRHFELKMWVCVSDDFDVKQLIAKIIKSATKEDLSNLDLDQLQECLRNRLNGKRFLLVLDDVWSDDPIKWSELKALLMGGANGSKIIVTTRSNQIASIMGGSTPHYNLEPLPKESCLSLFITCAFIQGQEKQYPNLLKIGTEIVKKCGGVPLAVKTLGSLLYSVTDEHEWILIQNNDIWELEGKKNDILAILRLSYDRLPSLQKRCFAYCSIFPKDYQFNSDELIQLWMAHELLQSPHENEELEDIGISYLKELWSKSFFQDFEQIGMFVNFQMHDIMHDLATLVSKGECMIVNHSGQRILKKVGHLSIPDFKLLKDIEGVVGNLDNIRTICCPVQEMGPTTESFFKMCVSKFNRLRVLGLSGSSFEVLPRSIGDMKHLRCLDIRENNKIKKIPNSICKLQSLQTLTILGCEELEELPRDMKYMVSLRFLEITTKQKRLPENGIGCLKSLRYLRIFCCENLEYLFEGMQHLTALRTLMIANCPSLISLPRGMKCLTALESLLIVNCEKLNLTMELEGEDNHQDPLSGFNLRLLFIERLPEMVVFPQWLLQGSTNSLLLMVIKDCAELTSLPEEMHRLTSLRQLRIEGCPALSERCEPRTGEDWPKIAHVPGIEIDGIQIKSTTLNQLIATLNQLIVITRS